MLDISSEMRQVLLFVSNNGGQPYHDFTLYDIP